MVCCLYYLGGRGRIFVIFRHWDFYRRDQLIYCQSEGHFLVRVIPSPTQNSSHVSTTPFLRSCWCKYRQSRLFSSTSRDQIVCSQIWRTSMVEQFVNRRRTRIDIGDTLFWVLQEVEDGVNNSGQKWWRPLKFLAKSVPFARTFYL